MPHSEHHSQATSPQPTGILKQRDESQECASPSSYLGLSYTQSPRATPKSVSIAPQTELISPLILGMQKSVEDLEIDQHRGVRKPAVKSPNARRLSGRPLSAASPSLKPLTPFHDEVGQLGDTDASQTQLALNQLDLLLGQVSSWVKEERAKRTSISAETARTVPLDGTKSELDIHNMRQKTTAHITDEAPDLDRLDDILKQSTKFRAKHFGKSPASIRHRPSIRRLPRKASSVSSDTDYFDSELLVPSCDVVLDNSKTLSYTGGASDDSDESSSDDLAHVTSRRDHDAWSRFKFELVKIAHTLRLKGWRKVPLDLSGAITIQRLSGALTNAVYVVSPPAGLPYRHEQEGSNSITPRSRRPPPKLLLRIYGPQVEHLIDRNAELAILRRLCRKNIGPKLLGTFANGRFEEFFHAQTLTAEDLRNPDTSRQIAKRMRELHEGIELLDEERDAGPFIWQNWDSWVHRVEQVVQWLDDQVASLPPGAKPTGVDAWKRRRLICGVPWHQFRKAVEDYRRWLDAQYGGSKKIREQLVFAHNDTQYGNILRLVPSGESPLLLPANTHKQLVVIDFEYANANLPGLEFANHFTEWCYDYHDKRKPYACNTNRYPTPEEQDRFLRAYVRHRPQFNVSTPRIPPETPPAAISSPGEPSIKRSTSSISGFMLDARGPHTPSVTTQQASEDAALKAAEDADVARLMHETRLWRLANTAQWVAWGIVQAKVPGMPDFSKPQDAAEQSEQAAREDLGERAEGYRELAREQNAEKPEEAEEEQEEFDYLGYAQHRAMFFWGDALQLGIVTAEELPEEVRAKVKTVPY